VYGTSRLARSPRQKSLEDVLIALTLEKEYDEITILFVEAISINGAMSHKGITCFQ
jgi:hypothetical protein